MAAELELKNHFLLAMPGLTGTYFGGTLTYLCEHNDDGAMGIIVNRPAELSLLELLSQLGMATDHLDVAIPVLEGGPVGRERGFIVHAADERFAEAAVAVGKDLMLSSAREVLEAIGAGEGPEQFLVALGYAGWEAGQLERELTENAWLTCPARPDILFEVPFDKRLHAAAASLGIDYDLLSGQAGHA